MAKKRNPSEQPPPYEHHQASIGSSSRERPVDVPQHQQHQTIPKSADFQAVDLGADSSSQSDTASARHQTDNKPRDSNNKYPRRQVDEFNKLHSCTTSGGQRATAHGVGSAGLADKPHQQFVEALAAPRAFLGQITVEPVAFIAMLALYIEFPAIQDLIYTKICLQVVANHPSLTTQPPHPAPLPLPLLASTSNQTMLDFQARAISGNSGGNSSANRLLPSNGRISQANYSGNSTGSMQPLDLASLRVVPPGASSSPRMESRDHLLCDRLNKSAIPAELRQEILDLDSLFWLKYQIILCSLCALASPYWGGLSDRVGRLIPLNASIIGDTLCNLISLIFGLLISLDSHSLFHVNWLYMGAVIVGLTGGQAVLIMNSFSFISDTTTPEQRTKRVTVLESVIYLSHSLGFFLNKLIMSLGLGPPSTPWLNRHFVAFTACILLSSLCLLISLVKLRHHNYHRFLNNFEREQQEASIMGGGGDTSSGSTLGRIRHTGAGSYNESGGGQAGGSRTNQGDQRLRELTSSTPDDLNTSSSGRLDGRKVSLYDVFAILGYYRQTWAAAMKPRDTRPIILLLLLSGFISALSLGVIMSLLYIYLKMEPFGWTTSQYSSWNSITSITRGVALVALTMCMKFVSNWNVPDPLVASVGFISKGVTLLMIGLAQSSEVINWALLAFVFSEYSMPPIRSLLSKLVVRNELGKIYSCLGSLQSICFIFGNVAFYIAYTSLERQVFFRLSFAVIAGIEFVAVVIMMVIYTTMRRHVTVVV